MKYQLLIIDNDDQKEGIEKILQLVKQKPFTIECHQFNVGLPDGNQVIDEHGRISKKLIIDKFNETYSQRKFHMVICDFKLSDPDIDGIDVVKIFNSLSGTRKAKKLLYSSELNQIVQEYLDDYKKNESFDEAWGKFKALINLEIIDFTKREEYEKRVVESIHKVVEVDNVNIVDILRDHKDLKFNDSIKTYAGMTFGDIAELIEKKDSNSINFQKELMNAAITLISNIS